MIVTRVIILGDLNLKGTHHEVTLLETTLRIFVLYNNMHADITYKHG